MTMETKIKKSPVALAVLALLFEEPMHTYKMWQLIKERAKDEVINVRYRNTLYQVIDRLLRDGLIEEKEVRQEENRPEQTIYELTKTGKKTALLWIREMIAEPAEEFPEFPVALAYLPMLSCDEVKKLLKKRVNNLAAETSRIETMMKEANGIINRLFLLESEFIYSKLKWEKKWVESLIGDIDSGKIYWDDAFLREVAEKFKNENK